VGDVTTTLQVIVSVLVISCPCAIGVTLPLIDEMAVARLRRIGVFVRAETLWARLARLRKVIFDKTGTLTLESLTMRNPGALHALDAPARAALWTLVRRALHPAAACVREAMMAGGQTPDPAAVSPAGENGPVADVTEAVGHGLEWRDDDGRVWRLGREAWVAGRSTAAAESRKAAEERREELEMCGDRSDIRQATDGGQDSSAPADLAF